ARRGKRQPGLQEGRVDVAESGVVSVVPVRQNPTMPRGHCDASPERCLSRYFRVRSAPGVTDSSIGDASVTLCSVARCRANSAVAPSAAAPFSGIGPDSSSLRRVAIFRSMPLPDLAPEEYAEVV